DDEETINQVSLVYLEKPLEFEEQEAIADLVAEVTPTDGECDREPLPANGLGTEVYGCHSEALEGIYSADQLNEMGLKGESGSYNYSVDPNADDYFEVIVQFGTDSDAPVPTPAPSQVPTLEDKYPPVADVRELAIGRG